MGDGEPTLLLPDEARGERTLDVSAARQKDCPATQLDEEDETNDIGQGGSGAESAVADGMQGLRVSQVTMARLLRRLQIFLHLQQRHSRGPALLAFRLHPHNDCHSNIEEAQGAAIDRQNSCRDHFAFQNF